MKTLLSYLTKYKFLLLVIVAAVCAGLPLLHPGLIPTHDGEYHLIRFFEFDKMLRLGILYPRWAPDLDFSYGLPLFTYVYPLPNYIASLFHALGASFLDSVMFNMFAATIIGAVLCYLWTKEFWGEWGGFVSSIMYTYAPYHFVDIYVRGSVGEVWALAVFPGFLWTYTLFVKNRKPFHAVLAALFLALTIFSHNILGLMFFIFALSYAVFLLFLNKEKKRMALSTVVIFALSLGVSALFWLPALTETKYVTGLQIYSIAQNFPDLFQLLFPSWGTGFFGNNLGDEMSVQIGVVNLLVIIVSIIAFLQSLKKQTNQKYIVGFFLLWFVVLFCFMLHFSLPLWINLPLIHYFQFPWRLLSLVILVCAFLSGGVISLIKPTFFALTLIILTIATTYAYTQPAYYMLRNDRYYLSRSNFIDSTNSPGNVFTTIWNTTKTSRPKERFLAQNGVVIKNIHEINPVNFSFALSAKEKTTQSIALSYFPGWQATIDNKQANVFPNSQGLLSFNVLKGRHLMRVYLAQTTVEIISEITSLLSFLLLIILILRKKI